MALIVLFTSSALAQSNTSRIGDDYARAALRVIIYTTQSGVTAQRISVLLDEATWKQALLRKRPLLRN
jgi:hypothetical protein